MLTNLQVQKGLKFSDPNRLFAEVVFSITQEQQWPGITNTHHKINIIAKLLRQTNQFVCIKAKKFRDTDTLSTISVGKLVGNFKRTSEFKASIGV